jgi:hypothetical protein
MGRAGDMDGLKLPKLAAHPAFDFILSVKITESKNINATNQAREQYVLGSADVLICPIFGMARYFLWLLDGTEGTPAAQVKSSMPTSRGRGDVPVWMKKDSAGLFTDLAEDDSAGRFEAIHESQSYRQRQVSETQTNYAS